MNTDSGVGTRIRCFGDYELLEEIGRGGMGVVYKARQLSLGRRPVALKMILSGRLATEHEIRSFYAEAKAAAGLSHPNIVQIHEIKEHQGHHYFTMQLVEGRDLEGQIEQFIGNFRASVQLIRTVARAVHYAHVHGIVHRDLKPANILIDAEGTPLLTDFGLAKSTQLDKSKTLSGVMLGTVHYMAPEQVRGGSRHAGEPADVFSLGVILYRLITGRLPFRGSTPYEILQQIVETEPEKPSAINPRVDAALEEICFKCIAKDPKQRCASARVLADDLEAWLQREQEGGGYKRCGPPETLQPLSQQEANRNHFQSLTEPVRVVLADDHLLLRVGIRAELDKLPAVQVVGEASDGRGALDLVRQQHPDVVFMDISMKGLNGLEATARITKEFPQTRVIILSMHTNEEYYWQAIKSGAAGYLLKQAATAELATALRHVLSGEIYLTREISSRLVKKLPLQQLAHQVSPLEQLTERQREILQLIAEGQTTKSIALILMLSPRAVKYHRAKLMERLKIFDIPGLVRFALRSALIVED